MRATTIAAPPGSSRAFIAGVGKATQRAAESKAVVFFRVSKAPTVLALVRWRNIRPDGEHDASNVDTSRKFMALKGDLSNIGGVFLATLGGQGVAANVDSIILAE